MLGHLGPPPASALLPAPSFRDRGRPRIPPAPMWLGGARALIRPEVVPGRWDHEAAAGPCVDWENRSHSGRAGSGASWRTQDIRARNSGWQTSSAWHPGSRTRTRCTQPGGTMASPRWGRGKDFREGPTWTTLRRQEGLASQAASS